MLKFCETTFVETAVYFSWVFKTTDSIITLNMWTLYTRQERENKNKKKENFYVVFRY